MHTSSMNDSLYRPGLQDRSEAVISAHFMHRQNLRDEWQLYSGEEYSNKAINLESDDLLEIVAGFSSQINDVVENRLNRSFASARRNSKDYGIKDANKVGAAEIITEALLDRGFRKGPLENVNKLYIHGLVKASIEAGKTIDLIVPLLPNKVDTPLKTNGADPCLAEANLLCRLGEIAGVVDAAYKRFAPDKAPELGGRFTVLADGHRFQSALNVGEDKVNRYQTAIKWWIHKLGLNGIVHFHDYEAELKNNLEEDIYSQRSVLTENARLIYRNAMLPIFDVSNIEVSMQKAIEADPYPDEENPEARFVPLFKSILYTYESDFFLEACAANDYDPQSLYREITQHAFQEFTPLTASEVDEISSAIAAGEKLALNDSVKEFFRRQFLEKSWNATIEYLAAVKSDRDLFEDPVAHIYPDHIRYTIHSKKGQIGLNTTGARGGELVQAWHGVAYVRPRKDGTIQFDNGSRLMMEGEGYTPVTITSNEADSNNVLSHMAQTNQAIMYVHKDLGVQNAADLKSIMQSKMTRLVFDH